ncbi:MAG: hypothetical protein HZB65_04710 [Candidatus Aenigmarchaeota archaeon]|nr:hypothetical protein [Candidatus Aenigmarchaeota archaeon]
MTFFESHLSCQGKKYYTFHYNKKGIMMKNLQIAERTHEANISRLVKEFGPRKERMIREFYNSKRVMVEGSTSINDFSAIMTYRKVREKLMG